MKLSTNSRYGLRAMIDLAANCVDGSPVALCAIAQRQQVSESYLEQAFSTLRRAGLVKSVKGAQGGYLPAAKPSEIKVGDILRALEGSLQIIDSSADGQEDALRRCLRENVWEAVDKNVAMLVDALTLEDMAKEYKRMRGSTLLMYNI